MATTEPDLTALALDARVQTLSDELEIRRVLVELADAGDRYDLDRAMACFHPDAIDEHGDLFTGNAHDFLRWGMDPDRRGAATTIQHCVSNMRIEVHGDVAASQTYVVATHLKTGGDARPTVVWFGGRYLDRFERREGVWRIAHRRVIQDWDLEVDHVPGYPPGLFPRGTRSTADQAYALFQSVAARRPWPTA